MTSGDVSGSSSASNGAVALAPRLNDGLAPWARPPERVVEESSGPRLFEARVTERPDAVAVVCEDVALSYAELNARANRVARLLRARGAGTEDIVGVAVSCSADMVVALLGVLKAGARRAAPRQPRVIAGRPGAHAAADRSLLPCPSAARQAGLGRCGGAYCASWPVRVPVIGATAAA